MTPGLPSPDKLRWSWKRGFLLIYAILLVASHIVRLLRPAHSPRPDQQTIQVSAVDHDRIGGSRVTIAYVDSETEDRAATTATHLPPSEESHLPVILLLHGSPVASSSLMALHRALNRSGKFRIITPDLPGFAGSTFRIPDYSNRAHAYYVTQLLDSLHVRQAHIVSYSMSGGVVIEESIIAPDRLKSVTLLSSIGVQEMELMGEYHLNHAVHGLQLAFLWIIQEGFPHFGWMDDAILSTGYARNFYDTDQRPYRDALKKIQIPVEIIHGKDDPLVPFEAALEHERLIPQSELHVFQSGGHGLAFSEPDTLASLIGSFVDRVENGTATRRRDASSERIAQAAISFDPASRPPVEGTGFIVLCTLIILTTLVSEDLACIGAGLFAASGTLSLAGAFGASFTGIVIGDVLIFFAGRTLGYRIVSIAPFKWFIASERLERGETWFKSNGVKFIFTSRFIPGTRFATYFSAGVMRAPVRTFLVYFLIAAAVWTPLLVGSAYLIGAGFWDYYHLYETYALWGLLLLILMLYMAIHVIPSLIAYRGRKLLVSKWNRITRWEYWPLPIFYAPVAAYVLWLGVRFRSLSVFTAANPGIAHGGFVGESKSAILSALEPGNHVPVFALIPEDRDASEFVNLFMRDQDLEFPIVLKPDIGERGRGVRIIHERADIGPYFEQHHQPTIVQKFAPGNEFGVFYYRFPDEEEGHIFSITDKRIRTLSGDGLRTLEHLILDDPESVGTAPLHLRQFEDELDRVPTSGEKVSLVEIGTHSLGAIFLDATGTESREFTLAIDRAAKVFEGFFFGRFDVRIPGGNPLDQGENFQIIELNGVTSEATRIYDPKTSLFRAYQILFAQWHLAFSIGSANAREGASVTPLRTLWRLANSWSRDR